MRLPYKGSEMNGIIRESGSILPEQILMVVLVKGDCQTADRSNTFFRKSQNNHNNHLFGGMSRVKRSERLASFGLFDFT